MSTRSDGTRFAGTLTDGRSATAARCEVSVADTGLSVHAAGEARARLWPYHELRSSVPLRSAAADVLLSREPGGTATLFVADPFFAPMLLARAPGLSAARQRWRGLQPGLMVVAAAAAIALGMWLLELHPAQAVARVMPQHAREALGRNVITALTKERRQCETPAGRAALDRLTQRLATTASGTPLQVRVMLLDWNLVNAFAAPGGQIILTRGLVQQAGSPDEVAGVLAHEMGHVLELHPEAGIVRAMGLSAATQLMFAGSTGTISNIGVVLAHLRYTRIAEGEADAHALRILKGAGISHKGLGDFFTRIEGKRPAAQANKRSTAFDVIRTHPLTDERIALVRAQPDYPATPALSAEDWRALRDACGAAPTPTPAPASPPPPQPDTAQADRDIAEATKTLEANAGDAAALQKRARAYGRKRQHALALADYTKAVQLKPDDAALHVGRGFAHQSLRQYDEALADYDAALRLVPNHAGARNGRGNSNRALKRYDVALADFDEVIKLHPKFVAAYYNRALVNLDLKRPEEAMRDFTAAIAADKDYAGAYTQRGLIHEKAGARDPAIADFRAALAAPAKYESGQWAHRTARERLKALGVEAP